MRNSLIVLRIRACLAGTGAMSICLLGPATAQAQTFLAGDVDDFGGIGDPGDTLIQRPLLAQWLARTDGNNDFYHNGDPMPFDEVNDRDWEFGYTFENLPLLNQDATLRIRVHSNTGSSNDGLWLQFTGDGTPWPRLWGGEFGPLDAVLNGEPGTWETGRIAILELNLGNLPFTGESIIDDINNKGYLDVLVLDDTAVDWIELVVPAPGSASLLALGGVLLVRRRR